MKKIIFAANSLNLGGIETALVSLVNCLAKLKLNNKYKYDITVVLEKKEGIFLNQIDKRINVIEYRVNSSKNWLFRKTVNFLTQSMFKLKYKNKFDFSVSYATYSLPCSFVARTASTNSTLWCHMDYLEQYKQDEAKFKQFFEEKKFRKFNNIVFVSKQGKESFNKIYPELKNVYYINNIIDAKKIIEKSKEIVQENIEKSVPIFLNVGRHDEEQKKLSRIIDASKMLKDEKFKFKVLFVGEGQDTEKYKAVVLDLGLEDTIIFLGKKANPYPYFKLADCILLSSDYEGFPVVFIESMVLNKPIITTKVSGSDEIDGIYGCVIEKNEIELYKKMMGFIVNGKMKIEQFNANKYNEKIINKIENLISN